MPRCTSICRAIGLTPSACAWVVVTNPCWVARFVVDEASLADTRTLAHLTGQAEAANAKILLVGDPAQRGAVEAGGAFAMLVNRGPTAQLRTLRRFTHPWEARAVLALRHGSTSAIDAYAEHRRLHAGGYDDLVGQIAQAAATGLGAGQQVRPRPWTPLPSPTSTSASTCCYRTPASSGTTR